MYELQVMKIAIEVLLQRDISVRSSVVLNKSEHSFEIGNLKRLNRPIILLSLVTC